MKRTISHLALAMVATGILALTVGGCGSSTAQTGGAQNLEAKPQANGSSGDSLGEPGKGMAAIKQAADAGKYLFLLFYKADDDQTLAMRKVLDKAVEKAADRAQTAAVNITDAAEKRVVDKFDVSRAPMPLILAIAPNGAITGGFPTKVEEQQLLGAFASPGTEKVMKPLQDGKLVFVCLQNDKTKSNEAAMQGVRDFKADARFASATEIITLDPTDKKEASFLTDLKVPGDTAEAVTVFVVPPGQVVGKFVGETNKETIVDLLSKANTSCGPGGCGPGGCCPAK